MGRITINNIEIELIGHDSFKLKTSSGKVIYFDPFAYPQSSSYEDKASYVFISHEHFDHCSIEVLRKIANENTKIIAPERCKEKIDSLPGKRIYVNAETPMKVDDLDVLVVHAYNPSKPYHPKGMGNGYVVDVEGMRFYHPGDTDFIPEMEKLKGKVDVFFVPISGIYVMDEDDALKAIKAIMPRYVIPMHYNYLEGLEKDPEKFKEKVENEIKNVEVIILI